MTKKEEQEKVLMYASMVDNVLTDMMTNEDSEVLQSLKDEEEDGVNITPFITGMCIAHLTMLKRLCAIDGNFLDGIHMENRLIVQYLMKHGTMDNEENDNND